MKKSLLFLLLLPFMAVMGFATPADPARAVTGGI
jgi:hypothetical protein